MTVEETATFLLKLVKTNDELITCVICGNDKVEWETGYLKDSLGGQRSRVFVGLHEKCRVLVVKSQAEKP